MLRLLPVQVDSLAVSQLVCPLINRQVSRLGFPPHNHLDYLLDSPAVYQALCHRLSLQGPRLLHQVPYPQDTRPASLVNSRPHNRRPTHLGNLAVFRLPCLAMNPVGSLAVTPPVNRLEYQHLCRLGNLHLNLVVSRVASLLCVLQHNQADVLRRFRVVSHHLNRPVNQVVYPVHNQLCSQLGNPAVNRPGCLVANLLVNLRANPLVSLQFCLQGNLHCYLLVNHLVCPVVSPVVSPVAVRLISLLHNPLGSQPVNQR